MPRTRKRKVSIGRKHKRSRNGNPSAAPLASPAVEGEGSAHFHTYIRNNLCRQ